MKHKRRLISIAMATIVLISLCAVCASTSVSAADSGSSRASVQASTDLVGASIAAGTGPSACLLKGSTSYYYTFVKGYDGALWHIVMQKDAPEGTPDWGWGQWKSLGGQLTSAPAATSRSSGTIDVFVRGGDGAIWQRTYNNGWSSWKSLGGQLAPGTGPAVCAQDANSLDVFVQGTDHALWHKHYQSGSGWGSWKSLGGYLTSSPAAASWDSGRIDVSARGSNGAMYHKWYSRGWSGWESLGGNMASGGAGPAMTSWQSWGSYRLDAFITGTDGAMWQKTWNSSSGWSGWTRVGGIVTASQTAMSWNGYIILFARGGNGYVYMKEFMYGAWYPWSGGLVGPPCQQSCHVTKPMNVP